MWAKLIRLIGVLNKFIFIFFIDLALEKNLSVIILILLGWINVVTLSLGMERQFRASKIRATNLTLRKNYISKRIAIIILPAFFISTSIGFSVCIILGFNLYAIKLILFAILIVYWDQYFLECSKVALTDGDEYLLAVYSFFRSAVMPLLALIHLLVNSIFGSDFLVTSILLLMPAIMLHVVVQMKNIRRGILFLILHYLVAYRKNLLLVFASMVPKINNSGLRTYIGLQYDSEISLVAIKMVTLFSAVELVMDIFFWPKNYRKLMSTSMSLASVMTIVKNFFKITSILYLVMILLFYVVVRNCQFSSIYFFGGAINEYMFALAPLVLIVYIFSLETLISYIAIKSDVYLKSQFLSLLVFVTICIAYSFFSIGGNFLVLLSTILVFSIRINYALQKH